MVKLAGYLAQRRAGYEAVVDVPPSQRLAVGRVRLRKGLGTRDVHVAKAKLPAALMELHARISASLRLTSATDPVLAEALALRNSIEAIQRGDLRGWSLQPEYRIEGGEEVQIDPADAAASLLADAIADRAERIEAVEGPVRAASFAAVASGRATPLSLHVPGWLAEPGQKGTFRSRTVSDYTRILSAFEAWVRGEGLATTVEGITRRIAGRYLTALHAGTIGPARVRTIVSALSSYWAWMTQRGIIEDAPSPWLKQAPRKAKGAPQEPERAFTGQEVTALLREPPDAAMNDLMQLAAQTGARIEELCSLTVAMCQGGLFAMPGTKTLAARRVVPIHSELTELVERRTKDKQPSDYLLHELGKPSKHGDRSGAIGKRFGRYRQTVGVHDKEEGRRRAKTNFHSWRRWFVTTALQAGQQTRVVEQIVGHALSGMTEGVYFGGDTMEAKRACVEAVELPVQAVAIYTV